ncbi:hypothetical protein Epro_0286 [Endomicrobium proavitum]|uniref:Uncharacterized protein n=2 Tax=Endomicrobium proavitum TaxID=1408281 RepID=A0A0G3WIF3_9BACT|nr:hypothetical protein Epro_0286 [Endomicrobium proavitum]
MILVISWAMMLNIAKLIRDRMVMQNEADSIALNIATHKARTYNFVGSMNYLIGVVLSLGMESLGIQFPSYSTDHIGGFPDVAMALGREHPLSDFKHNTLGGKKDNTVSAIKKTVDVLSGLQDIAIISHKAYHAGIMAENFSNKYNIVTSPLLANMGIKRNSKGIKYYKTLNACAYISSTLHFHTVFESEYDQSQYSWFVEDEDLYKQKIKVTLRKKPNSNNTPLFARLLNIKYPEIIVYSAAAPYNTKGSLFPKTETTYTGNTLATSALNEAAFLEQLTLLNIAGLRSIKFSAILGPEAPIIVAAAVAFVDVCIAAKRIMNVKQDNPIDAYDNAKAGGWGAHLVPYVTERE